ncbi:carbohydrate ABC transporter permease [Dactylosporangium sp. AC04546]|uniref:carbohydrate ABC transporter permease n=1 Tax=Dactylosporangium sp. AC04546 TaxID=2862460 RepID=UPI001EDD7B58|nr:carbohydrate ABC transporter permease [Dactylosporangium sp. AC04546]WVK81500.1 carbohydrate ABC transporter permease [Dactylosporangium sp. AC04546]
MSVTLDRPRVRTTRPAGPVSPARRSRRPNIPAAIAAAIWLAIVAVPIYYVVVTGFRSQDEYIAQGPLDLPRSPTLDNFTALFDLGFTTFLLNSVLVAAGTIALVLVVALPAAYAIVRNPSRLLRTAFNVFLLGLAVPAQAVIVPVYLIITRLRLYDTLLAVVLPTAAFSLPIAIVVLTSTLRDIPGELYEAMTVDGATPRRIFSQLVLPLARPGLVSVGIFVGLGAWNGFLFPLVLTQSQEQRVLPLGLWNFQNQYGTNVPGLMAAVVLSALPVLTLYLFGRRHLLSGLAAGFGK